MRPARLALLSAAVLTGAALAGCGPAAFSCEALNAAQSGGDMQTCAFAAEMTDDGFATYGDEPATVAFGGAPLSPDDRPPLTDDRTDASGTTLIERQGVAEWRRGGETVRRDSVGPAGGTALSPGGRWAIALADGRLLLGEPGEAPHAEAEIVGGSRSFGTIAATGESAGSLPHTVLLAFSPDGARLVGVDSDSSLVAWDASTGERLWAAALRGPARALTVSPDGARLAVASENTATLWDAASGEAVGAWATPRNAEAFSFDGAHLAVWFPSKTSKQTRRAHETSRQDEHHVRTRSDGVMETLATDPRAVVVWRRP